MVNAREDLESAPWWSKCEVSYNVTAMEMTRRQRIGRRVDSPKVLHECLRCQLVIIAASNMMVTMPQRDDQGKEV